jgi:hypothetical protein
MAEAARVLRPGGVYLQVSFSQPHFRKQYLLQRGDDEEATAARDAGLWERWQQHTVPVGFGYFCYCLTRTHAPPPPRAPAPTE